MSNKQFIEVILLMRQMSFPMKQRNNKYDIEINEQIVKQQNGKSIIKSRNNKQGYLYDNN